MEPTSVTLELRVEVELGVEVSGSHRLWMLLSAKDSMVATYLLKFVQAAVNLLKMKRAAFSENLSSR